MHASVNIHASCVRVGRSGILLLGKSGAGKSDLALRLIGRGAVLVADDRTLLAIERGILVARVPPQIAGMIEVRGVGLLPMRHTSSAQIVLVVDLVAKVERLPAPKVFRPPKPLSMPPGARPRLIALDAFETSAADKILAVLAALRHNAARRSVKYI